jgi:ankyrin repeat protein
MEMVKVLLEHGADVNQIDMWGFTPLHVAEATNDTVPFDLLLQHGSDVHAKDSAGETAQHCAAKTGREHHVRKLLAAGASVDVESEEASRLYVVPQRMNGTTLWGYYYGREQNAEMKTLI